MNNFSGLILVIIGVLCTVALFLGFVFVMMTLRQRLGNWHEDKIKALNKDDLTTYGMRNMLYSGLIGALFFLPVVLYMILRPSFFDPSWTFFLIVGGSAAILVFQAFQYVWLNSRTNKKSKDDKKWKE